MNKQEKKNETKRMIDRVIRASIKSVGQSARRIESKWIFIFLLFDYHRSIECQFSRIFFFSFTPLPLPSPPLPPSSISFISRWSRYMKRTRHTVVVFLLLLYSQRNVRYNTCDRVPSVTNESLLWYLFRSQLLLKFEIFVEDNAIYFI